MGLEITQPATSPLTINGNVYAASDYYNKQYNLASGDLNRNYSITSSNDISFITAIFSAMYFKFNGLFCFPLLGSGDK